MSISATELARLYDDTIRPAWRLACCLTGSAQEAEQLVVEAYAAVGRAEAPASADSRLTRVLTCLNDLGRHPPK